MPAYTALPIGAPVQSNAMRAHSASETFPVCASATCSLDGGTTMYGAVRLKHASGHDDPAQCVASYSACPCGCMAHVHSLMRATVHAIAGCAHGAGPPSSAANAAIALLFAHAHMVPVAPPP